MIWWLFHFCCVFVSLFLFRKSILYFHNDSVKICFGFLSERAHWYLAIWPFTVFAVFHSDSICGYCLWPNGTQPIYVSKAQPCESYTFSRAKEALSVWQLQNKVEKKPCHSGDRERIEREKKESSKIHDIGWDPRQIRTASFHFRYVFGHHIHILVVYVCWIIITAAMFKRKSVSEMLALLTWSFVKIQYEWIHFEQWIQTKSECDGCCRCGWCYSYSKMLYETKFSHMCKCLCANLKLFGFDLMHIWLSIQTPSHPQSRLFQNSA